MDRAVTPRGAAAVIASATIVITVAAGLLMTVVERERYPSIGEGLWWAIQTTTTVGYGDNVPTTVPGRFVAVLVMFFGIGFLTVITAAITSTFVSSASARLEQKKSETETSTADQLRQLDGRLERIETVLSSSAFAEPSASAAERGGRPFPSARRAAWSNRSRAHPLVIALSVARRGVGGDGELSLHPYEESRPVHSHHVPARAGSAGSGPPRATTEGWFQYMTTNDHSPGSRWLKAFAALVLATAVLAVAGCGDSDTPAVCDSLETLSSDVAGLQDISLEDGEAAVTDLEESFDSIRSDLDAVKSDAEAELSEPIAGLETSLDAVSTQIDAIRTAGTVTAESVTALGEAVTAVGTSMEALKSAVPDCDL